MKRCLWLCVVFLLAGHIPVVSADAACEGVSSTRSPISAGAVFFRCRWEAQK